MPTNSSDQIASKQQLPTRYRILYEKGEPLRYTGHLDMQRNWVRILRRAHLNIVYSLGYHPQPRIQQASALPLGYLSLHEVVDIWLVNPPTPEVTISKLQAAAPPGLKVFSVSNVDQSSPPLQTLVRESTYQAEMTTGMPRGELEHRIAAILSEDSLPRERRGKKYNLRPLISHLFISAKSNGGKITLEMRLAAKEGATGRPDEVISALGLNPLVACITRTNLVLG